MIALIVLAAVLVFLAVLLLFYADKGSIYTLGLLFLYLVASGVLMWLAIESTP